MEVRPHQHVGYILVQKQTKKSELGQDLDPTTNLQEIQRMNKNHTNSITQII